MAVHRCSGHEPPDDEACGLGLDVDGPIPASNRGTFARGADAAYIAAAHPAAVLALIAELRAARAERDSLRAVLENLPALFKETRRLRDALRPFAAIAAIAAGLPHADAKSMVYAELADCRAAAALLAEPGGAE